MLAAAGPGRTFEGSRGRSVVSLLLSLVLCVLSPLLGGLVGWLIAAFFGYLVIAWLLRVIRPNQLVLDPTGFQVMVGPRRRPERYRWIECGPFHARSILYPWQKYVVFQAGRPTRSQRFNLVQLVAAGEGTVEARYVGISPDSLAALMNDYRTQALRPAGDSPTWQ